jgi:hypothetical protein
MTSRTRLERKQVDDVLGGEEMWKHADSTAGEASDFPDPHHDPFGRIYFTVTSIHDPSLTSTLLTNYAHSPTQLLVKSVNMAEPTSISFRSDPPMSP